MKIRIKFAKYGVMKYIGHLDMMRFFQKAIRRAGIDVRYSEGYSPHQIMSFAAPLGVGAESLGEYLDIEVHSMDSAERMTQALNAVMVEGVEILSVTRLPDRAKNAMASVAAAAYQIHKKEGSDAFFNVNFDKMTEMVNCFLMQESIHFTKETKKSVIEMDLKKGIYAMRAGETKATKNGMSAAAAALLPEEETVLRPCLFMTVDASSAGNIKPSMVFGKLCEYAGTDIPFTDCQVTKLETYADVSEEGEPRRLVPLFAVS